MQFTRVQISELIHKHATKVNGLHDPMEFMFESMMIEEQSKYLRDNPDNKANGYRPGHTYGYGKRLEFRIPRDRYGNFTFFQQFADESYDTLLDCIQIAV